MGISIFFLALVFGIHIVAVNVGIALATLVPILKRRAESTGDSQLVEASRGLFRIYAATYALAGVMGTAFTVFLLSFYPEFVGVAGNITMVPFGIAIVAIVLHFFAIVAYWYGWDAFDSRTHFYTGVLLTVTAYLIPLGFRAVFAFLNTPIGLEFDGKPSLNVLQALANPTFLPLYLKSVVGALALGALFVSAVFAFKGLRSGELSGAEESLYLDGLKWGTVGLFAMAILGAWYAVSLTNTPIKFNNIFSSLGWAIQGVQRFSDYSWLFLLKMALVVLQAYLLLELMVLRPGEAATKRGYTYSILAAVLAALTVLTGEYLNAFSQYPYFVANLPLVASSVPEPWRTILGRSLDLRNTSPLALDPALYSVTILALVVLFAAAGYFLYVVFFKKE
ncbi:cytochrome ubiquinol oxidase subunit I [Infirmifilum lucidum]|uniref:Cytochrome ubiquinol oxidase subunit I n=1 Tax=Infirmifilum lucidum TaxID=2776706 RepID=A0A7L9FJT8_9CREN|nr:cytochrome ubiquinol oxidase subunit I [Infirmifilum lucidum]QOJ79055.1 cytochrome ubiquinol oxidase subunit I [Infirmifilum lucidum]